jgi:hypothetical protein
VTYEPTAMQYVASATLNAAYSLPYDAAFCVIVEAARISKTPTEFDAAVSSGIMLAEIVIAHGKTRG